MRECITIPIGQAGLQISDICLDIYCLEHGINFDGTKKHENNVNPNELLDTLFNECPYDGQQSRFVPRSILVDHDPSVIQTMLTGPKSKLYSSGKAIHGKEDAANNFARGSYLLSEKILEKTMDIICKSMEQCDSFQAFILFSSFGGGTGSGLGARLIDELEDYFWKKNRLELNVFPSPLYSTATVEPYNAVFRAYTSLSYSNCMILFDNEACYENCLRQMNIELAHHYHINQLISQVASSVSASTRFSGPLNVDLAEFQTNLVPYPRLHFLSASYAPILDYNKSLYQNISVKDITNSCFEARNHLINYDLDKDRQYVSCCLLYRGDVTPQEVNSALIEVKNRNSIRFANCSPTGFKTGIASEPPRMNEDMAQVNRALCQLANNTAIKHCWRKLTQKFDLMFCKRAFVHWFVGEGMEEEEFKEAREGIQQLMDEYEAMHEDQNSVHSQINPSVGDYDHNDK